MLVFLIIWICFGYLEGRRDGSFYHANMLSLNPVKENLHWLFTMTRGIVLGLIAWLCFLSYSPLAVIVFIFGLILIFSLVHNGVYYLTRNRLDANVYPKGFWDTSVTSTSFIELNPIVRMIMAVVGLVGIGIAIIM